MIQRFVEHLANNLTTYKSNAPLTLPSSNSKVSEVALAVFTRYTRSILSDPDDALHCLFTDILVTTDGRVMSRHPVALHMRLHPFVTGVRSHLRERLHFYEYGDIAIPDGCLFKADTYKEGGDGFSLQARVPEDPQKTGRVLWIRGDGKEEVKVSPRCNLVDNFGGGSAVDNYVSFAERYGAKVTYATSRQQPSMGHYGFLTDDPDLLGELVQLLRALVE